MKYLNLLLIMGVYSLCYIGIKFGLPHSPPLLFGALRLSLGGAALLALILGTKSPWWPKNTPLKWMLLLGFVATAASTATMFLAAEHGSAGMASVLGNMQPILTLVLALAILRERVTPGKVKAAILGIAGIVLISLPMFRMGGIGQIEGAALALGSSAVVATANILVKRFIPKDDILPASAWQLVMGCIPLFIASLLTENWSKFHAAPSFIGLLLFLGLIGTGYNTFAWYKLVKREDVGFISMFYFVVPVIGLISGWLVFGETLMAEQWVGMAVIASALVFLAKESKSQPEVAV
jgi:probable blue pigment (indigoidine) exporter